MEGIQLYGGKGTTLGATINTWLKFFKDYKEAFPEQLAQAKADKKYKGFVSYVASLYRDAKENGNIAPLSHNDERKHTPIAKAPKAPTLAYIKSELKRLGARNFSKLKKAELMALLDNYIKSGAETAPGRYSVVKKTLPQYQAYANKYGLNYVPKGKLRTRKSDFQFIEDLMAEDALQSLQEGYFERPQESKYDIERPREPSRYEMLSSSAPRNPPGVYKALRPRHSLQQYKEWAKREGIPLTYVDNLGKRKARTLQDFYQMDADIALNAL
jgi:hypothetical protein